MNKYYWNFNEHEEVWYNSCPTIEDCIEEAKWEKEDREIAENHVFIGDLEPYKPFIDVEYLMTYKNKHTKNTENVAKVGLMDSRKNRKRY